MTTYLDRMEREQWEREDEYEFVMTDSLGKRYRTRPGRKETSVEGRIWNNVDKNGPVPDGKRHLGRCWIWTAKVADNGYASIWYKGKYWRLHRMVFKLEIGDLVSGMVIGHKCNVKRCCRPSHLEQITSKKNTQDAIRDGLRKPGPYSKEVMS